MTKFLTLISIGISICSFGQQTLNSTSKQLTPIEYPTNIERYNVDYKLVDTTVLNGNWQLVNQINLENLEQFRSTSIDVIVSDPNSGFEIILFNEKKITNSPSELLEK
jgi:hypothetical protein